MHAWEIAATIGTVCGVIGFRRFGAALERWLALWLPAWAGGWRLEAGLALLPMLLSLPGLWACWSRISPYGSPVGADSDGNYASALALETGNYGMYEGDRYPLYPWLCWLASPGAAHVHTAGTLLSMAATLLIGPVCYAIGRQLAGRGQWEGRIVGVCGALMAYRMPVIIDSGRSFTPYPLIALIDLGLLALLLGLAGRLDRGGRGATVAALCAGVGLLAAAAMAADPKQLVAGLSALGLAALLALVSSAGWRWTAVALTPLLLSAPLMHAAAGRVPVQLMTVEEITTRVNLGFQVDRAVLDRVRGGYTPGKDLGELIPTLRTLAAGVRAPEGQPWLHPRASAALPLIFPQTSPWWLLVAALLPARLLWRSWRSSWSVEPWRRLARGAGEILCVAWLLALGGPTLHLHYQHRYAMPQIALLPVLIAAVPGAGAAGGVLVALAAGPYPLREDYLDHWSQQTDAWVGVEPSMWVENLAWSEENFGGSEGGGEGTMVFDFSESRPWPLFGVYAKYLRCNRTPDGCRAAMAAHKGPDVALLWAREQLSGKLAGSFQTAEGVMPGQIGCWGLVRQVAPDVGLYRSGCE